MGIFKWFGETPEKRQETIQNTPQEQKEKESKPGRFDNIQNFDELYTALREAGSVTDSSGRTKDAEWLIKFIEEHRNLSKEVRESLLKDDYMFEQTLRPLTRNGDLRPTVEKLFRNEWTAEKE
jgi:hypothetical protein